VGWLSGGSRGSNEGVAEWYRVRAVYREGGWPGVGSTGECKEVYSGLEVRYGASRSGQTGAASGR